ncbi:MAG: M20/M25/M40 family metallo-hydrolase, partial [Chloroflexia bacterium]|nr:M20/M25/M40 family metallo-hydrolase [Chloroflexia bacterium]
MQESSSGETVVDLVLAERVLAAIDQEETVAFLQELVRCPTVNPPGDVRAAAAVCAAKLLGAGFAVEVVGPAPELQNVVATLTGQGGGPRLAFNAHYDVVPTGEESGWRFPPFGGEIDGGRVYGRGAGDDKASVTAQVMAGVALARSGVPLAGTLIVTEVADEETGGELGAGFIVSNGHVEADYVIVGEQTRGQICIGERGGVAVGLTVFGATGHAATPW